MPKLRPRCVLNISNSSNEPGSSNMSMRSRAVRRPCAWCLSIRSCPPPRRASACFFRSCSSFFCVFMLASRVVKKPVSHENPHCAPPAIGGSTTHSQRPNHRRATRPFYTSIPHVSCLYELSDRSSLVGWHHIDTLMPAFPDAHAVTGPGQLTRSDCARILIRPAFHFNARAGTKSSAPCLPFHPYPTALTKHTHGPPFS